MKKHYQRLFAVSCVIGSLATMELAEAQHGPKRSSGSSQETFVAPKAARSVANDEDADNFLAATETDDPDQALVDIFNLAMDKKGSPIANIVKGYTKDGYTVDHIFKTDIVNLESESGRDDDRNSGEDMILLRGGYKNSTSVLTTFKTKVTPINGSDKKYRVEIFGPYDLTLTPKK